MAVSLSLAVLIPINSTHADENLLNGQGILVRQLGVAPGDVGLGFVASKSAGMLLGTSQGVFAVADDVSVVKAISALRGFTHHHDLGLITIDEAGVELDGTPDLFAAEMSFSKIASGRTYVGADGSLWIDNANNYRDAFGNYESVPAYPGSKLVPFPHTLDIYGNLWGLVSDGARGQSILVAKSRGSGFWENPPVELALAASGWIGVVADRVGAIWVFSDETLYRADLRDLNRGWVAFHDAPGFPQSRITTAAVSPSGVLLIGLVNGDLVECDLAPFAERSLTIFQTDIGRPIGCLGTDVNGDVLVWARETVLRLRLTGHRQDWSVGGVLPFSNHDLRGIGFRGRFYVTGGRTDEYGIVPGRHDSAEIYAYDPDSGYVSVVARLKRPRLYNALVGWNDELWVIGGNVPTGVTDAASDSVEIWDALTGLMREGPSLNEAYSMPVARRLGDRIFVVGSPGANWNEMREEKGSRVESIGIDESHWKQESDCPVPIVAATSCELAGVLYLMVQDLGLISYDPDRLRWDVNLPALPGGRNPRSSQLASHAGRVWSIGGRDLPRGDEVFSYDPVLREWATHGFFPRELAWGAGGSLAGRLIVFGGAAGRNYSNLVYETEILPSGPDVRTEKSVESEDAPDS